MNLQYFTTSLLYDEESMELFNEKHFDNFATKSCVEGLVTVELQIILQGQRGLEALCEN